MKNIAVLGSTGSIGTQTLDVVRANPERLCVKALAAGHNITQLESQIREFHPQIAAVWDEEKAKELRICTADLPVKIVSGMEGLLEIAQMEEAEVLVTAIVGMIGIRPTIAAIKAGKDIALANKETLVTAGHIIMPLAKEYNVKILPVDSEHSAIFQSLNGEKKTQIDKILLTASGGPFRGKDKAFLKHVQLEDALKHPNWSMGHKITIDSASMVNKGLEVMEAKWLFDVELDQIQVVIQPHPFHGAVQRRCGDRPAWNPGYEASDPVCTVLSRSGISGRRTSGFLEPVTDHLRKTGYGEFRRTSAGLCSGKSRRLHADCI